MSEVTEKNLSLHALPPHMQLLAKLRDQIKSQELPPAEVRELPVSLFTDQTRLQQEREKAFYRRPIIVGHSTMVSETGDYFTHDLLGKPLLIARAKDGVVRAFLNVCRHRGMRLMESTEGDRSASFVCPYHQWTYGLDGKLNHVPLKESFGDIDLSCRNLKPVRCMEHRGLIWVQLDNERPIDVKDWLGGIDEDLAAFDFSAHTVVHQTTSLKKTNWKLLIEAFEDGYHVVRLHKKTVGPFFYDAQAATNQEGEHIRSAVARKDMQEILDAPPEAFDARRHASFSHFIFPNTITVLHPDYISVLTLFPVSIDETRVTHLFMAPALLQTEADIEHADRSFDLIENGVFQSEDYFVCEGIQAGLLSGANDTLLTGKHERNLLLFHDILSKVLDA